jgi:hypothetical protein
MKRLPHALVVGLGLEIAFSLMYFVVAFASREALFGTTWSALANGTDTAVHVLVGVGALYFARAATGRAAIGAKIVVGVQIALVGMLGCWIAVVQWHPDDSYRLFDLIAALRYAQSIVALAGAIGFALIARSLALSIALPLVAVLVVPVPALGQWLYGGFHSETAVMAIQLIPFGVLAALSLVAVWSRRDELAESPLPDGAQAFTRASKALWLRVIAAVSLAVLVFFVGMTRTESSLELLRAVSVLAPLCDVIALALFARAVLGLARTSLAPWLLSSAAGFAAAAAGMIAARVIHLVGLFYGPHGSGGLFGDSLGDSSSPLFGGLATQLMPLVAATGIALVLVAVARLARERNRDDVRENAVIRTGVFVALVVGAMLMTHFIAGSVSEGAGVTGFVLLAIAGSTLYALIIAAKLCAQGGELLVHDPAGLPAAKVISS